MFLSFHFKGFLLGIFIFSNKRKEKKNHRKGKKNAKKGRSLLTFKLSLCSLTFGPHFWPPIFTLFVSSDFSFACSSSQAKEKKKTQRKINHREKKKMQRREGVYLLSSYCSALSLLVPTFGLLFLPFRFKRFLFGIFFFSSKRKEKKM